ncbi:MAG: hypothetical protein A2X05_06310 [Bacteroidetes bacterium GWE2_41_25]|nr:MAG: hypothetical protein A2X06_14190 [Bacteroidetes bacterium GWC2_40_22]OFX99027.1 MAG: hypothetical protein A2X05_06310 [Bacteroidetes bacterium GWE2_41_25]OFY59821.1 MAG: hypothetical protein A2X04_06935 [Bacteroidetes bacterium GWF2_41_9]HBH83660.1 hypothetical protein [Bacteroidales bacterium]
MKKMNSSEIRKLIISSLENETDNSIVTSELQESLSYDFSEGFEETVLERIFALEPAVKRQFEFDRSFNLAFYRIAFTGAAAIVILLISLFLKEGSLSFDSLLGVSDSYSESIICLLTGK